MSDDNNQTQFTRTWEDESKFKVVEVSTDYRSIDGTHIHYRHKPSYYHPGNQLSYQRKTRDGEWGNIPTTCVPMYVIVLLNGMPEERFASNYDKTLTDDFLEELPEHESEYYRRRIVRIY